MVVDLQYLVVSLLNGLNLLLVELQPWVAIEEAKPFYQVVVLVHDFLSLEELEVFKFSLGSDELRGAIVGTLTEFLTNLLDGGEDLNGSLI